jgi:hypothetical protein
VWKFQFVQGRDLGGQETNRQTDAASLLCRIAADSANAGYVVAKVQFQCAVEFLSFLRCGQVYQGRPGILRLHRLSIYQRVNVAHDAQKRRKTNHQMQVRSFSFVCQSNQI